MKRLVTVDGREVALDPGDHEDAREVEPGVWSILRGGKSWEARVSESAGCCTVEIGGRTFSVDVFDARDRPRGARASAGKGPRNIAAPMPGKIVRVLVTAGDAVIAGQGLVVVEAMKMQNEMKSPKDGKVVRVHAYAGGTVGAGDVLVVIE